MHFFLQGMTLKQLIHMLIILMHLDYCYAGKRKRMDKPA